MTLQALLEQTYAQGDIEKDLRESLELLTAASTKVRGVTVYRMSDGKPF